MVKSAKSRAEKYFTASERVDKQFLIEKAKAEQARADHTARLRNLRLAKEAAEKDRSKK